MREGSSFPPYKLVVYYFRFWSINTFLPLHRNIAVVIFNFSNLKKMISLSYQFICDDIFIFLVEMYLNFQHWYANESSYFFILKLFVLNFEVSKGMKKCFVSVVNNENIKLKNKNLFMQNYEKIYVFVHSSTAAKDT